MENVLTQFNSDQLEIKLTSEKLFINTPTSNEAFALRSVNGIGVLDLLDDYNKELTDWRQKKLSAKITIGIGVFFAIPGLWLLSKSTEFGLALLFIGAIMSLPGIINLSKLKSEPKLMSAVRIMISGGNRDFKFDKTGVKSGNVADFVAKVESTLTSYHKNHD